MSFIKVRQKDVNILFNSQGHYEIKMIDTFLSFVK